MPELELKIPLVRQTLDDAGYLLLCPTVSGFLRLVPDAARSMRAETGYLASILAEVEPAEFQRFVIAADAKIDSTSITIPAPSGRDSDSPETVSRKPGEHLSANWSGGFELPIHYLTWQVNDQVRAAYVPAMRIHALTTTRGNIAAEVQREMRLAMVREGATTELANLVTVARRGSIGLEWYQATIAVPTAKDRAKEKDDSPTDQKTLKEVASRHRPAISPRAFRVEDSVRKVRDRLMSQQPESVLLVGPAGVGKSAIFQELVRRSTELGMESYQFWQTDGSRLIAGMCGFGEWQERVTKLVADLAGIQAVIHLGNLMELGEVGRGGSMTQGIADFLRPFIARRKLLAVAECTTEQLRLIERHSPQLLDAFRRIEIAPPDERTTGEILLDVAADSERSAAVHIDPSAIDAINRLHNRFAVYSARPGRAIRFFKNLLRDTSDAGRLDWKTGTNTASNKPVLDEVAVTEAFSRETGLPLELLDDRAPLLIEPVREWFSSRLIGQPEPLKLVVDVLAAVKAKLNRPGRPIASLLFIGPTGVGKTEMAKAIARFMYRDENRMVRIDMSEYGHPASVPRLIGGFGQPEGVLTGKVRQNPFTVVLLDEFEKAHPLVFDLLLQVLGEGRLTDGFGNTADFSTSIIIMTSNLGVDSFRGRATGFGGGSDTSHYQTHFVEQVRRFLRPEMFNRIDRIVPFQPLERDSVLAIAGRELQLLEQRDGIAQYPVSLNYHGSVLEFLAREGFDPAFGARPLKRVINRRLAGPISRKLNDYPRATPLNITITAQKSGIHVSAERAEKNDKGTSARPRDHLELLDGLSSQRRRGQALNSSPTTNRIRNELYRLQQTIERRILRLPKERRDIDQYKDPVILQLQNDARVLEVTVARTDEPLARLANTEQQFFEAFYLDQPLDWAALPEVTESLRQEIDELILDIFLADQGGTGNVQVFLFSHIRTRLQFLANVYQEMAQKYGIKRVIHSLHRHADDENPVRLCSLYQQPDPKNFDPEAKPVPVIDVFRHDTLHEALSGSAGSLVGVAFRFQGRSALQRMSQERGVHLFRGNFKHQVLVEVTGQPLEEFQVPLKLLALASYDEVPVRRIYDPDRNLISDDPSGIRTNVDDDDWNSALLNLLDEMFRRRLDEVIQLWK